MREDHLIIILYYAQLFFFVFDKQDFIEENCRKQNHDIHSICSPNCLLHMNFWKSVHSLVIYFFWEKYICIHKVTQITKTLMKVIRKVDRNYGCKFTREGKNSENKFLIKKQEHIYLEKTTNFNEWKMEKKTKNCPQKRVFFFLFFPFFFLGVVQPYRRLKLLLFLYVSKHKCPRKLPQKSFKKKIEAKFQLIWLSSFTSMH